MGYPFRQRSPRQILWIIAASCALMTFGFGAASALSWHLAEGKRLPLSLKLPCFIAMLIGLIGTILGESALNRGIKRHQWSEDTLAILRKNLNHPAFNVLTCLLAIGCLISMVISPFGHGTGVFIAFATPFQTLDTVRISLRPRIPSAQYGLGNALAHAKPLHSDHWGAPSHTATK